MSQTTAIIVAIVIVLHFAVGIYFLWKKLGKH